MRYGYILSLLYLLGTLTLHAEEKNLGSVLQKAGIKKKVLNKPVEKKQNTPKQSRFIFKDEYQSNNLGVKGKNDSDSHESKNYIYENKSRFKFKFNNGTESNFVAGQRSSDSIVPIGGGAGGASIGGASVGGGAGGHGGQGFGGGRR